MLACRISIAAAGLLLAIEIPAYAQKCEGACVSACENSNSEENKKALSACDSIGSPTEKARCLAEANARNKSLIMSCIARKEAEMKK
jgi:hypothetical protein